MISDEVLMLAFQQGSGEAFDELYARYRGPLHGFFRRRLNSELRAEDLAQETFLVVIRGADRYQPRALVRTYLYAIALKLLMSERRKRVHDGPDVELIAGPANYGSTERELWLREGLQKLDQTEREILMLREYEQLKLQRDCRTIALAVEHGAIAAVPGAHRSETSLGLRCDTAIIGGKRRCACSAGG